MSRASRYIPANGLEMASMTDPDPTKAAIKAEAMTPERAEAIC